MPLIGSDIAENMAESSDYGQSRTSSGSTALKSLISKSKGRNKSVDREDKKDKEKDKDKKKGFFEQFRPRSKSDVSGLKRPSKKQSLPTEQSMDEATLMINQTNYKSFGGSQETITPMGQILEGQMLNVPTEKRVRHISGPSAYRDGGFMSKFRARSNSESKPKSPKKTLQTEKGLSPPSSPRADRSGLSPLKFQAGEPRSAPPQIHQASMFNDPTHAIIYKADVNKLDPERVDIETLDDNQDLVYAKFMRTHTCYELLPTSGKLVIFDTQLNVKKAFFALIYNGVRAAPLWDNVKQDYVGMLTITDFIYILKRIYKAPDVRMDELEDHKIEKWRELVKEKQKPFISISPDASLFDAIKSLLENHVHRLPVIDSSTGNAIYIITHKRILRYLNLYKGLRQPPFMKSSLEKLGIGTYTNVITITPETPLITALNTLIENRISALPVVNSSGEVINLYAKFDVINLAADKSYNNLDITVGEALRNRQSGEQSETVCTCYLRDTLSSVMEKIIQAEVHRLVVVDDENHVKGIVSLSDLLDYLILRPVAEAEAASAAAPLKEETALVDQTPLEEQEPSEDQTPSEEQTPSEDKAPLETQASLAEQVSDIEPDLMVTETPPPESS
uniref:CBS domain-containing protein n=1 Tax=Arion vulgaris TaxID=1028688 RepID=A0A0B7A312_9EUPU